MESVPIDKHYSTFDPPNHNIIGVKWSDPALEHEDRDRRTLAIVRGRGARYSPLDAHAIEHQELLERSRKRKKDA